MTFLEIGLLRHDVQDSLGDTALVDAPSVSMWCEYFSRAQIHGVAIQDFSMVESDRITFTRADQSDRIALSKAIQRCRYPIKVIIDDASHVHETSRFRLPRCFPIWKVEGFILSKISITDQLARKTSARLKRRTFCGQCQSESR
jgi:hypothetical protein